MNNKHGSLESFPVSRHLDNWYFQLQHTPPDSEHQNQVDSLSPTIEGRLEVQLPAPLHPLTTENLRIHTQQTNPGEKPLSVMSRSGTGVSQTADEQQARFLRYGVSIEGPDKLFPPAIEKFLAECVEMDRAIETPGARELHMIQPRANGAKSESASAEMLTKWLMFRDETDPRADGELFISLSHEACLNRYYVKHAIAKYDLAQPKPDRANGYVSNSYAGDVLTSPFDKDEEVIINDYMGPVLHDEALFAWLTGEFKSATGRSIKYAKFQCARNGVAACNYMRSFLQSADIVATEQDTIHFSLACDSTLAILYIHWIASDDTHIMKQVYGALLHAGNRHDTKSEGMVTMRKYLRNILEWATGPRLTRIKQAIKIVKAKRASEQIAATNSGVPRTSQTHRLPSTKVYQQLPTPTPLQDATGRRQPALQHDRSPRHHPLKTRQRLLTVLAGQKGAAREHGK